jgi:peroxiredoxin
MIVVPKFTFMKKFLLAILAVIVALPLTAQTNDKKQRPELALGSAMPQFVLESSVYGKVSSADLKGKVVLINMFATWCGPCQKELAEVKDVLWPKFKDNGSFKMLVIGREHTDEQLKDYNEIKKFSFPMYPDPKREVYSKFADITIPRAYLFGKDGKLIHASKGFEDGDMEKVMKMIEEAL